MCKDKKNKIYLSESNNNKIFYGKLKKNKMNGNGLYILKRSQKIITFYMGEFLNGITNGNGLYIIDSSYLLGKW